MDGSTKKSLFYLLLMAFGIWSISYLLKDEVNKSDINEDLPLVSVSQVHYKHYPKQLSVYGKIMPLDPMHIDAEITAKLIELPIKEGQQVKKGDQLARFDATNILIKRKQIEQSIEKIESMITQTQEEIDKLSSVIMHDEKLLKNAQTLLERYLQLSDTYQSDTQRIQKEDQVNHRAKALINNQQLKNRLEHQLEQYHADLVHKKLELLDQRLNIEHTTVTAPFSGVVTKINHRAGDYLTPGSTICTLIDPQKTYLNAYIPAKYHQNITTQLKASIPNTDDQLTLEHLDQVIDPKAIHLDGIFYFDTPATYPIGEIVKIMIELPLAQKSFLLQASSLYHEQYVYAVKQKTLQKHPVSLLGPYELDNQQYYLATSPTLSDGDYILTTRVNRPHENMKVRYE